MFILYLSKAAFLIIFIHPFSSCGFSSIASSIQQSVYFFSAQGLPTLYGPNKTQ